MTASRFAPFTEFIGFQRRLRNPMSTLLAALLATSLWATAQAQVGLVQLKAGDLPVTVVYPTAEAARPVAYGPFSLNVAPDAPPRPGRHRLVLMSHGTGGASTSDHALAATLARAGFVVAQVLHAGDNFMDTSRAGPESWASRPGEISRVIDALAAHPNWQARLQLDRVGVHGMSAGGVTALSLAGAQWRVLDLVRHCQAHGDDDFGFCFNGLPNAAAQDARRKQFDSLRNVPEDQLPPTLLTRHGGRSSGDARPDARVAAVTVSVPVAAIFTADSLARIRVPVGVVTAGRDRMLLPRFHSAHVLRSCPSCSLLADLPGAGHMDLLAPWPADLAQAVARQQSRGGEPEPGFDPVQRQAAFDAIAAFFDQQL